MNIAPKKPNWDLRRDVQKKLDKLERRTQKALYQLMCKFLATSTALTGVLSFTPFRLRCNIS